jgi:U3 small nucleolar RNA-associated protein 20
MGRPTESKRLLSQKSFRPKKATQSTKKYRFEPFSQRIARLKIDPVRRSGSRQVLDGSTSYFHSSFNSWKDLNLSAHFTAFCKETEPYCDSLPQIIHHAPLIAETLISYLQNGTEVSLEPLLDLVAQLAHDLGQRFESHFAKIVETVNHIASSNPHFDVIEWSFNCLAWLFKYLSRLLVPDLRPLFDLMAPLLGQDRQKEFVTRFAAESFSFLIRRASIPYHKEKEPLRRIVKHILSKALEWHHSQSSTFSVEALSTLFGESIKGVNGEFSSNGDAIFHEVLHQYLVMSDVDPMAINSIFPVIKGVLSSIIPHTTGTAFISILKVLILNAENTNYEFSTEKTEAGHALANDISRERIATCLELLLIPVCMNGGKIINDWDSILSFVELAIDHITNNLELFSVAQETLSVLAACHCTAPIDSSIRYNRAFQTISSGSWIPYFLGFCDLYIDLDHERFLTFMQPHFKGYVNRPQTDLKSQI